MYTPTHATLQGIILWVLLSKKNKKYYKEHRWEFVFISLCALIPDIDLLFGIHRSYTHSLIIPVFIILSMLVTDKINKDVSSLTTPVQKVSRFAKLACIMWMMHIFLDISWGPSLLFWPLDNHLYDLSVYLRFENQPWLFFPLTFAGLIPNWSVLSMSEGQNIYFINLTQQQRQDIYGNYINLSIGSFTFQVLMFVVWCVVILFPAFKRKNGKKKKKERKIIKTSLQIWKRVKRNLTVLGLFVLLLGLVLGPIIGNNKQKSYNISYNYRSTQTFFDPTLGVVVTNFPQRTALVNFTSETGLVEYNVSVMITSNNTFIEFFDSFENLLDVYNDGNISYSQLLSSYFILVNQVKTESYFETRLIGENISKGYIINLNSTDEETSIYLITLVDEWNITESYIYTASMDIIYEYSRKQEQIEGGVLDGIGLLMIVVDQLLVEREVRKKKSSDQSSS